MRPRSLDACALLLEGMQPGTRSVEVLSTSFDRKLKLPASTETGDARQFQLPVERRGEGPQPSGCLGCIPSSKRAMHRRDRGRMGPVGVSEILAGDVSQGSANSKISTPHAGPLEGSCTVRAFPQTCESRGPKLAGAIAITSHKRLERSALRRTRSCGVESPLGDELNCVTEKEVSL